jgi:hypothetical protein
MDSYLERGTMNTILDEATPTIPAIQQRIEMGRTELHTFLGLLTVAQREQATDAAGWTVKDHTIHLAVWEKRLSVILTHQKFPEAMGIPHEIWEQDVNSINAFLQERDRHLSWSTVMAALAESHTLASQEIAKLSDAALLRPFSYYQPDYDYDTPIKEWVMNNTFKHYGRHLEWMRAITKGAR